MKTYSKSEVLEKLRAYFREINATSPERMYAGGLTESQVQFLGHADLALRETVHMTILNAKVKAQFPKTVNA